MEINGGTETENLRPAGLSTPGGVCFFTVLKSFLPNHSSRIIQRARIRVRRLRAVGEKRSRSDRASSGT